MLFASERFCLPCLRLPLAQSMTKVQRSAFCKQHFAMVSCYLKHFCLCIIRVFVLDACCAATLCSRGSQWQQCNHLPWHTPLPSHIWLLSLNGHVAWFRLCCKSDKVGSRGGQKQPGHHLLPVCCCGPEQPGLPAEGFPRAAAGHSQH